MKAFIARMARRSAEALNNLAERLDPQIEAAAIRAEEVIAAARAATKATVEKLREQVRPVGEHLDAQRVPMTQRFPKVFHYLVLLTSFLEASLVASVLNLFGPVVYLVGACAYIYFTLFDLGHALDRRCRRYATLMLRPVAAVLDFFRTLRPATA